MGRGGGEMSVGYAIDPIEIKELSATRTTEPSRLRELAQRAEEAAVFVDNHWETLDEEQRRTLHAFICLIVDPPKGITGRLRALRSAFRFGRIRFNEDQDALFDFAIAQRHLINAILSAIERDNPEYQKALTEAVEGAVSETRESRMEAVTDENTGDWLRRISDEALK